MTTLKAKKVNMTQVFADNGEVAAVTMLRLAEDADMGALAEGAPVTVTGTSKGKGFQGVVKRHGFKGGRRSHGQKHSEREPGSISGSGGRAGGRVAKAMRMAGRMGGDRVTVKNLTVAKVDPEARAVYITGAIPGRRGSAVEVRPQM
jgi:large subunit ribosomal protein L3